MTALIVAGAPVTDPQRYMDFLTRATYVIAADSGADLCLALGRVPDLFVGDADSVTAPTLATLQDVGVELRIVSPDKSVSDLDLAFAAAQERGIPEVTLTAAWGGRVDHSLAVIGSLFAAARLGPVLREPSGIEVWVLAAGGRKELVLSGIGRTISVMAGPGGARVSISGTRWELADEQLAPLSSQGLSNVIVEEQARFNVREGSALVIVPS